MSETALLDGLNVQPLEVLHESDDNPREISDERFDALKYALSQDSDMLQARPIIATPDGEVVCGNMRLRALLDLGWTEAPVFVKELSQAQKREWMLRDNQEYGDWVPEDLAAMVAAHSEDDGDLRMLGFSEAKTDNLLKMARDEESTPGGNGDGSGHETPPDMFAVVVECESEEQQAQLIEELTERGHDVRALMS